MMCLQVVFLTNNFEASNLTYKVNQGDSLYLIGKKYGVSVQQLKKTNNLTNNIIYPAQLLKIPASITEADKDLLARLVSAEAVGEPYAGKVAVAVVVLNRVQSDLFPNTVKAVINQPGQFTPVSNGMINKKADRDSIIAVNEALSLVGTGSGSLYFYNPKKTSNKWLRSKKVTVIIGNHTFAK